MSIFRSTRRQRRLAAALAPYTVNPDRFGEPLAWPVDHTDRCRCTYCA